MSTASYNFGTGATSTSTGGYGSCIYTSHPVTISVDRLAAMDTRTQAQVEAEADCYMTVTAWCEGRTVSKVINVSGVRSYYNVGLSLTADRFERWHIDVRCVNCVYYWEYGTYAATGGISGESPTSREGWPLDAEITITYTPTWTVDSQNEGYARNIGYDTVIFTEFEKDENGYPRNWGVWKLDSQNDGYPWKVGYETYTPLIGKMAIIKNGTPYQAHCVIFKNGQALPAGVVVIKN